MMLFCCRDCAGGGTICELRIAGDDEDPPDVCPYFREHEPRWLLVPSGRSTMPRTGADILPGPFCEIPATAIARATAEGGRYTILVGDIDRFEIPVSRAAFDAAVTAMEEVCRDAVD